MSESEKSIESDNLSLIDEQVEEVTAKDGNTIRRKGVFLLPNLFTTGALFGGFFAIIAAMSKNYEYAAWAIFAAQVLDGFDGRVARMTKTESAFGVEYDSLSDMVSFGLAPAIVVYSWALEPLGKWGLAAAFVFTACAALRLARFNTHAGDADYRYFIGLASPPAATLVASGVWLGESLSPSFHLSVIAAILIAFVGVLMISNLKYHSFKGLDKNRRVPFVSMLLAILIFVLVLSDPPIMLFLLAFTYMMSAPLMVFWRFFLQKKSEL